MKLVKTSDRYNSALKRRELVFFLDHISSGTPRLYDVKKIIANEYDTNEEKVFVLKLETLKGTNRTTGIAEIYDQKERIMSAWARSTLRCSEGSMCKNTEITSLSQDMSTLDKDMVWNPLLRHWICIDCYNFYYESDSAKEELENLLKKENLL